MSTKTGTTPSLNIPTVPDNLDIPPDLALYLGNVMFAMVEYGELVTAKLGEFDSLSINGQGLNLTIWAANANIEKRDSVCVLFDGDPNVGTPGAGTQGWSLWSDASNVWVKM